MRVRYSTRQLEILEYRVVQLRKYGLSYSAVSRMVSYNRTYVLKISKENSVDTPPLPGHLKANRRTQEKKLKERAKRETYICKGCGITFERKMGRHSGQGKDFHSRECAFAHRDKWHIRSDLKVKAYCVLFGSEYVVIGNAANGYLVQGVVNGCRIGTSCKVSFDNCKYCGELFCATTERAAMKTRTESWHVGLSCNSSTYCCFLCEYRQRLKNTRDKVRADRGLLLMNRECLQCGRPFQTWYAKQEHCSNSCGDQSKHQSRRARQRAAFVEHVSIKKLYDRDCGRCRLCGIKVKFNSVGEPNSATRDHIIPLSKGGEHSYRNCQLACLKCNMEKGNRTVVGGEQLLMFG